MSSTGRPFSFAFTHPEVDRLERWADERFLLEPVARTAAGRPGTGDVAVREHHGQVRRGFHAVAHSETETAVVGGAGLGGGGCRRRELARLVHDVGRQADDNGR